MNKPTEKQRRRPLTNEEVLQTALDREKEENAALKKQIALAGGNHTCSKCDVFLDPEIECEIYNFAKMYKSVDPRRFWCGFHSAWGE